MEPAGLTRKAAADDQGTPFESVDRNRRDATVPGTRPLTLMLTG